MDSADCIPITSDTQSIRLTSTVQQTTRLGCQPLTHSGKWACAPYRGGTKAGPDRAAQIEPSIRTAVKKSRNTRKKNHTQKDLEVGTPHPEAINLRVLWSDTVVINIFIIFFTSVVSGRPHPLWAVQHSYRTPRLWRNYRGCLIAHKYSEITCGQCSVRQTTTARIEGATM